MPLIHCQFLFRGFKISTGITVCLPQPAQEVLQKTPKPLFPVLWLLHGLSDDHTIYTRRSNIERYAEARGLAVVIPAVNRSFYANTTNEQRYFTFIEEELPRFARAAFPFSEKRADNFVGGISMGGYGAVLHALAHPERFAAAFSLSGVLDVVGLIKTIPEGDQRRAERLCIYGDLNAVEGGPYDLFARAAQAKKQAGAKGLPALYAWCGKSDKLLPGNRRFARFAKAQKLPLTYRESPGAHAWEDWDGQLKKAVDWLPIKKRAMKLLAFR